jgi:hypothetical protein
MISYEPMGLIWDSLALELHELAAPRSLPHGFLEATLRKFCDESLGGVEDVFVCVTAPTLGTGNHVIGFRISGTFNRYATRAAKDALGVSSH